MLKSLAFVSGIGLLCLTSSFAQETSKFTFDIGAGFTNPVGNTARHLDLGWNLGAGVGYNFNSYVGAKVNLGYNDMGINSGTLANIGAPEGRVSILSATIDPIVHLNPKGHVDFYVTGGGGFFHRYQEFTQPSVGVVTGFDPFFGFYPVPVATHQILGSYSVNKPGIDVGAGFAMGTRFHGKFFAEAKYNRMFLADRHTDWVPVTFGFRW